MSNLSTTQIVLLILPIVAVELGLILFAIRDLVKPERQVRGGNKVVWALIIIVLNLVGSIAYFMIGREDA